MPDTKIHQARAIISDFDRTITQLFGAEELEALSSHLRDYYLDKGVTDEVVTGVRDPYALWKEANNYLTKLDGPDVAFRVHMEASQILKNHEVRAAGQVNIKKEVVDTIKSILNHRILLGIVSSNATEAIEIALSRASLEKYFKIVIGRSSCDRIEDLKPSPKPLLLASDGLGVSGLSAIYVGDSTDDMTAAKLAKMVPVGVLTGQKQREELVAAGAKYVMPSFSHLSSFLDETERII